MSFNILMEFDLSDLHLFIHSDEYSKSTFVNYFLNLIPPLLVYLLLHFFRKSLSLREFYLEEKDKIKKIGKESCNKLKYEINLHKERTKIKKFRNNLEHSIKLINFLGLIIVSYNYYLVSCFCGIYQNSFGCIVVNVLTSIASTFIFSIIVHGIESIKPKEWNLKKFLCKCYIPCFGILFFLCYLLTLGKFKDEFNDINDDEEEEEEEENKDTTKEYINNGQNDVPTGEKMNSN